MAKYTVLMSCGHEETIDLVGKVSERYRKIDYFKENGLCKECYKKKMEEESSKEPFNFNATVLPYINEENGNILLNVWFSGNTKPYKDNIKLLGVLNGVKDHQQMIICHLENLLCVGIRI